MSKYLNDRIKGVAEFLKCITACRSQQSNTSKLQSSFNSKQIFSTRNSKFVGPVSFSQSLVKWYFSGSKAPHTIDGALTASGGIWSLQNALKCSANSKTNKCFETGDMDIFADNTQGTGKTGRVKENGTTPVNVAINVVFIQSNPPSEVQLDQNSSPRHGR